MTSGQWLQRCPQAGSSYRGPRLRNSAPPVQNWQPQLTSCLEGQRPSCALRLPLPSSWFCLFLRSPIRDFHLAKSHLRTRVPLSPEFDKARSSLYPSFPHNHSPPGWVHAVYKCTVHPLLRSPSCPSHSRSLGLIIWCHGISGSTPLLSCSKARWFITCEPVSRFSLLRSALNLSRPSLKINAKQRCCLFAGMCSNALVRRKLTKLALGMFCRSVVCGCSIQVQS